MADESMERYNLDGIYFRVMREGDNNHNACLSDLTDEEFEQQMANGERPVEWYISCIDILRKTLRDIGEQFGIRGA